MIVYVMYSHLHKPDILEMYVAEHLSEYNIINPTSKRALKKRAGQQIPCTCKERESVSVGSVCAMSEH